jgi:mycothiol synthase
MDASDVPVIVCPAPMQPAALRVLHEGLPEDQRGALVEAIERVGPGDSSAWDGLLVAAAQSGGAGEEISGAVWAQTAPGATAVVWPPPAKSAVADALLRAASRWCDERLMPLAQLSVSDHDGYSPERLEACGFARLAELLYLYADAMPLRGVDIGGDGDVEFVPRAGDEPRRLAALIDETYVDTQDCPALDGLRSMADVLTGYGAQGRHLPEHWYFAQLRGEDAGVLILADHPTAGNCELVYMGVVPRARGGGLGEQLVRKALAAAAEVGAQRLVLAVDAANQPALALYRRAGFIEWERRTVFAHCSRQST